MIEAHTVDAWTRPLSRTSRWFQYAVVVGGFAAPLFLWLAGTGVALSAASMLRKTNSRASAVDAVCRRGLEIFILAFLFRLQSLVVTPGNYPVMLFRVDILNIMGPAIVAAGLVWGLSARPSVRIAAFASVALAVAMVTPLVRTWPLVDRWPLIVQWYLRPAGDYTAFTLFPWAGFVFGGAACGVVLAETRDPAAESRSHLVFLAVGAALIVLGVVTAARPALYPQSSFWTTSPTYFAMRAGILAVSLAVMYAVARVASRGGIQFAALARIGRSSLFIYWIHVELVYGYATWPLRHRLPLWGTAAAGTALVWLLYAAIGWRDRLIDRWRSRHGPERTLRAKPVTS